MTRSDTNVMDVWDVGPAGGAEVANIADAIELVSFAPDGRRLTTADHDGSLDTLDLETGQRTHRTIGCVEPTRDAFSGLDVAATGSPLDCSQGSTT